MALLISVIVTTYNSAKTIKETLLSVVNQKGSGTEFDVELLVIDDASTDDTVNIIREIEGVRLFENKVNSGGPNRGRNIGLSHAKGEWIAFIDHDDVWHENKLSEQLKANSVPVISCGYDLIHHGKNVDSIYTKTANGEPIKYYAQNQTLKTLLARDTAAQLMYFGSILIHASLKHIRFEETYGQVDFDYIIKILDGNASAEICRPLFTRNVDGNNLSLNENYRINNYRTTMAVYAEYSGRFSKEIKRGMKRLNAAMGRYYYQVDKMKDARHYLFRSKIGVLNLFFIATSFFGADLVKRFYRVFN